MARAERNKFTLKTAFLERPPVKSYLWRTKGESLRSILANRFPWLVLPPPTIGRLRLTLANCRFVRLKRRGIGRIESPERGTIVDRAGTLTSVSKNESRFSRRRRNMADDLDRWIQRGVLGNPVTLCRKLIQTFGG